MITFPLKKNTKRIYNYLKENGLDMTNISFVGYGSRIEKYKDERGEGLSLRY